MENIIVKNYTPHIRVKDSVTKVMLDVIIALLPAVLASALVYGVAPLLVIMTSVGSAVAAEWLFSAIFFKKYDSVKDLSAVVTGILLSMVLAPFTPLHVVAFGGAMAVIYGKLIYSGLGRNRFNPAITGREFMTVFFTSIMTSGAIWYNQEALVLSEMKFFGFLGNFSFLNNIDSLILKSSGAIGEYSILLLVLGGVYLLYKDRISWHIPVMLFTTVFLGMVALRIAGISVSLSMGELMLCGIFMATDMPTSSSTPSGKIFYGIMMGIAVIVFWIFNIKNETLSYAILLMNGFVPVINDIFTPLLFGEDKEEVQGEKIGKGIVYGVVIVIAAVILSFLHHFGLVRYLLFIYIIYTTVMLARSKEIK